MRKELKTNIEKFNENMCKAYHGSKIRPKSVTDFYLKEKQSGNEAFVKNSNLSVSFPCIVY